VFIIFAGFNQFLAYGEEAAITFHAKIPKASSVQIQRAISSMEITPSIVFEKNYIFPHVFSVFVSYNGASKMKVMIVPEDQDKGHSGLFFKSSKGSENELSYSLIDTVTKQNIPPDGTIVQYDHDLPFPLASREFKIGMIISLNEKTFIQAGEYKCILRAIIIEGE
jgi:hypothetical protein